MNDLAAADQTAIEHDLVGGVVHHVHQVQEDHLLELTRVAAGYRDATAKVFPGQRNLHHLHVKLKPEA
jgi:hypothetical protein